MRFFKKLAWLAKERRKDKNKTDHETRSEESNSRALSQSLEENLNAVKDAFGDSSDLMIRVFSFGEKEGIGEVNAALVFLDGLVNQTTINDSIIKPLMHDIRLSHPAEAAGIASMDEIRDRLLSVGEIATVYTCDELEQACLAGNAVLMAEGFDKALDIGAKGWDKRAVSEPTSETALRAPREGFTENLRTNTSMIRRKIKDPALKIRSTVIGKRTRTQINILYMEGITDPGLVSEVERRLKNIDTDGILATGYVEQYIEDSPASPFPTIWSSEKPDAVAGKLLEGRVAVAVDGAPFVLTMPMLFVESFQNVEDYLARSHYATTMRILRMLSFFICLFAPAVYIALSSYHQELIPTTLLFSMAASSEGTPFPVAGEMTVMMLIFVILQEAGIRMPRPVGQTISIVGALVMGDAAVQAGIVGAPVVIVVAMTAVSSFAIPYITDTITILSWFLLILATIMGSFGITVGAFVILVHLASLRSFGAPYLSPFSPLQTEGLKDTAVRAPLWRLRIRPRMLKPQDLKRDNFPPGFDPASPGVYEGGKDKEGKEP